MRYKGRISNDSLPSAVGSSWFARCAAMVVVAFVPLGAQAELDYATVNAEIAEALSGLPADLAGSLRRTSGQHHVDRLIEATLFRTARAFSLLRHNYPVFQFAARGSAYGNKAYSYEEIVIRPGTRGLIVVGVDLLDKELQRAFGEIAVETIIAHEFAHIYQAYAGLTEPLSRFQTNTKARELHADYLAGWFMSQSTAWDGQHVATMSRALYERGDYMTGVEDHHGTPAERFAATMQGFLKGPGVSLSAAAANGRQFVDGSAL